MHTFPYKGDRTCTEVVIMKRYSIGQPTYGMNVAVQMLRDWGFTGKRKFKPDYVSLSRHRYNSQKQLANEVLHLVKELRGG